MRKIAFLDRDGALIYEPPPEETSTDDVPYQIDSLQKLRILPGVIEGLQELINKGYKLVMISNQDALGSKVFPYNTFELPQLTLLEIFKQYDITFMEIFICPHSLKENCNCRKPKTGLVDKFLEEIEMDRNNSFMLGDRDTDGQFANNIGVRFIKVETNSGFTSNLFNNL